MLDSLLAILEAVLGFVVAILLAIWVFFTTLATEILPYTPLIAWLCFWLFAVNWAKLRRVIFEEGGWTAILLLGFVTILIWGSVAPGVHHMFGLKISNFVGKTVYVTGLLSIMFLCGSVQLSGCCASCCKFESDEMTDAEPS